MMVADLRACLRENRQELLANAVDDFKNWNRSQFATNDNHANWSEPVWIKVLKGDSLSPVDLFLFLCTFDLHRCIRVPDWRSLVDIVKEWGTCSDFCETDHEANIIQRRLVQIEQSIFSGLNISFVTKLSFFLHPTRRLAIYDGNADAAINLRVTQELEIEEHRDHFRQSYNRFWDESIRQMGNENSDFYTQVDTLTMESELKDVVPEDHLRDYCTRRLFDKLLWREGKLIRDKLSARAAQGSADG